MIVTGPDLAAHLASCLALKRALAAARLGDSTVVPPIEVPTRPLVIARTIAPIPGYVHEHLHGVLSNYKGQVDS